VTTAMENTETSLHMGHLLGELRQLSLGALSRMFLPDDKMFYHCIRRGPNGDQPEGVSRRYTAIALIGLATESDADATAACGGVSVGDVCSRLLSDVDSVDNIGDVALTLWAAALLDHPDGRSALTRLKSLDPVRGTHPTVEVAWCLTALSAKPTYTDADTLAAQIAKRIIASYPAECDVFPHWPNSAPKPFARAHISCFADMVYPVQALSYYYLATQDAPALEAAKRGGQHMIDHQGAEGQWWWHFDCRTGKVVEGFPVYSVHQDSMAPMALFALQDAAGVDPRPAVEKGLEWLVASPEIDGKSLIDRDAGMVWRKVARHEPAKMVRGVQAMASKVHPNLRAPVNSIFRPGFVDYECRPYHLGWILHAFPKSRVDAWDSEKGS
jgi:hypothetical protein